MRLRDDTEPAHMNTLTADLSAAELEDAECLGGGARDPLRPTFLPCGVDQMRVSNRLQLWYTGRDQRCQEHAFGSGAHRPLLAGRAKLGCHQGTQLCQHHVPTVEVPAYVCLSIVVFFQCMYTSTTSK